MTGLTTLEQLVLIQMHKGEQLSAHTIILSLKILNFLVFRQTTSLVINPLNGLYGRYGLDGLDELDGLDGLDGLDRLDGLDGLVWTGWTGLD